MAELTRNSWKLWSKSDPLRGSPDEGAEYKASPQATTHSIDDGSIAYDQVYGYWPPAHPLPLPRWAAKPVEPYKLQMREFEDLAGDIEMELRNLLEEHNYDTVGNFLELYHNFKKSHMRSAIEFFHKYTPRITAEHHTCVGLALELRHRLIKLLEQNYPDLRKHLYIVSCEETIDSVDEYTALKDSFDNGLSILEKEHCLLCLKFEINGRNGVLLCDPGYHVARVVTVMADKGYPHTGWFIQSEENNIRKEYNYSLCGLKDTFVQWDERTMKNGVQETFTGIIYVERPYLTAVDVTERRNLTYTFRSLLSRDQKGNLVAGVYFKVKPKIDEFTIFYQDMGKQRMKITFSSLTEPEINEDTFRKISIANDQLRMPKGKLLHLLQQCGELLRDEHYLRETLAVENLINVMSENN